MLGMSRHIQETLKDLKLTDDESKVVGIIGKALPVFRAADVEGVNEVDELEKLVNIYKWLKRYAYNEAAYKVFEDGIYCIIQDIDGICLL
jgi:hypothetical protein